MEKEWQETMFSVHGGTGLDWIVRTLCPDLNEHGEQLAPR
jgi:hypothetical protein